MKQCFQYKIDQTTKELSRQILDELTKSEPVNSLVREYRDWKFKLAEAEAKRQVEKFIKMVTQLPVYEDWLKAGLKRDEHRRKKLIPDDDLKRVKLYISQLKTQLPAVIPTAVFTESKDRWGRTGRWRIQAYGTLTGFAVLDADHVPNPEERIKQWLEREDFKELDIVWIFITASGQGIKVVFKAREDWGNLADNYYTLAEKLGVLEYADGQCKNADHCHFVPRADDIRFIDWDELFNYENPAYEQRYGEAYRRGESEPTKLKWQELERRRKNMKADCASTASEAVEVSADVPTASPVSDASHSASSQCLNMSDREMTIVKALNKHYGEKLPEGKRHEKAISETIPWLLLLSDNNPDKALKMASCLDWIKNWTDQGAGELESIVNTVQQKPFLRRRPKQLVQILSEAGIDDSEGQAQTDDPMNELPFDEWIEQIRSLFDIYPCIREVCEPHPERLWPFLLFAAAALYGTMMTLTWYPFYDGTEKRRLNYNVLGIGDPASGKGALVRISKLITQPMEESDQIANDMVNAWKEEQRSRGANKDKTAKPKGLVRLHGARTSNNVFINDMVNAWQEVNGERMQMHMLTVDTEALNSIRMQKGGSWIDKQVMEIKAWSNETDSQQYANLDSVTGFFNVYWNLVRTCTPPALKILCNEGNFGTGYPTRLSAIPVPGTGFKMIEMRRQSKKSTEADDTLRQWAYKLDKRQGELPLWPLVEYAWYWTNDHMEIAAFNNDKADELLLKRCSANSLAIAAPFVDMRHWEERENTGTYGIDDMDRKLLELVLDIQYRTQHFYFGELARNYFDEQMKDATRYRRRTTRYEQCFEQLSDSFTTEQFAQVFGFANSRSASRAINRLLQDKSIKRTKRGEYQKRVKCIK